jgi:GNAT superfamily N-acetyltransferase
MAGGYYLIPGYLIARLAIDASRRGQGYGEQLLLDALGKAIAASEIGGGRIIVVNAIDDEAPSFYKHYHFVPVRNREHRLVMKVSTAAKALGERWRE